MPHWIIHAGVYRDNQGKARTFAHDDDADLIDTVGKQND